MKKLCRTLLAGAMMALLWLLPSSPFDHTAVHAAVYEGSFLNTDTVFWKVDTDAGVLTIYGSGEIPYQEGERPFMDLPGSTSTSPALSSRTVSPPSRRTCCNCWTPLWRSVRTCSNSRR